MTTMRTSRRFALHPALSAAFIAALLLLADCPGYFGQGEIAHTQDILIEDFEMETGTYRSWTAEGDAFGVYPYLVPEETMRDESPWKLKNGYQGSHIISSFVNDNPGKGTLTSPLFVLTRRYLNFLIGGGSSDVYVSLVIDGREAFRESAVITQTGKMAWVTWDLSAYRNKSARVKIVDDSAANMGYIDADYFYLSDTPQKQGSFITRKITVTGSYLNFPINNSAPMVKINLFDDANPGGGLLYEIDLRLSDNPDYWTYLNCEEWREKEIEIRLVQEGPMNGTTYGNAVNLIEQTLEPKEKAQFYTEAWRPRYHYTVARAWLSDVCGVFFYNGKWHLQYQRNPFGTDWGNMHWGHAVSEDLVHWKELDNSIAPDALGQIFSGYSVIDENNRAGFGTNAIVSFYTSAGGYADRSKGRPSTQSMAYSVDGGFTWTKYSNNPALPEQVPFNHDPQVVWDGSRWVMALYLEGSDYGFYGSTNLKDWTYLSRYTLPGEWECPDFYKIKVEGTSDYKWVLTGVHGNYQVGSWDGTRFTPENAAVKDQDFGEMTFVPHVFSVPEGNERKVQIANTGFIHSGNKFTNQMTFPRELKLYKNGDDYTVYALPVTEISGLHGANHHYTAAPVTDTIQTMAYHLKAEFGAASSGTMELKLNDVVIGYDYDAGKFTVTGATDAGGSKPVPAIAITAAPVSGKITVELLSDVGFMELFLNNGETFGTMFQADKPSTALSVTVTGGIGLTSLDVWEVKSIWQP